MLDPEDFKSEDRKRLQDLFLSGSLAEEDIGALVHSALFEGDRWASQTLRTLAAETIGRGELPGQSLRIFTEIFLRHPDMKWQLGAEATLIGEK